MPGPWSVLIRFIEFFSEMDFVIHLMWSLTHILTAIIISFVIGLLLALLPFYLSITKTAIDLRLTPFLNSYSGIGWTLLAVLWFGINDLTVIFAITMVLIPFTIINIREGLIQLNTETIEMSKSFSRSKLKTLRLIILPSLYPYLFASIRISFGVSWKVALTAELFGGNKGLGYLLNLARQDFDTPLILVVILIIVIFVYSIERFVFKPLQNILAAHNATI
jgi:NitT/TauT family transport system permease protein/sulfonate transport system permease protein